MIVTSILTNKRFIFPELAKKMPSFAEKEQHRKSHEGIHDGMSILTFRHIHDSPLFYTTLFRHYLKAPRLDFHSKCVYLRSSDIDRIGKTEQAHSRVSGRAIDVFSAAHAGML